MNLNIMLACPPLTILFLTAGAAAVAFAALFRKYRRKDNARE